VKLKHLDEINEHKRALAKIYHDGLKNDFIKPQVHPDFYDVYHIFTIRHERRDALKEYLFTHGVKTDIHYPVAPHHQTAMQDIFPKCHFPISEEIHRTTLSLPISYSHTEQDIAQVVKIANTF
jgi:dTDP-4-amino-4,6-dideoxygalactose transaminase